MLWAAVWMCRAGQGASFCTDAVNGWSTASGMGFATAAGMDWDNVFNAASVMMLGMPDKFPAATLADVRRRMDANLNKWHVSDGLLVSYMLGSGTPACNDPCTSKGLQGHCKDSSDCKRVCMCCCLPCAVWGG